MRININILSLIVFFTFAIATQSWGSTWNGSVDDDWFNPNNWTPAAVPGAGDAVLVESGTILLTNNTAALSSFTISGGIVSLSNWWTKIEATDVSMSGGVLEPSNAFDNDMMSNRVWIVCTDLTVGASASINADGLGYAGGLTNGFGPGGGTKGSYRGSGGGYGGDGGRGTESREPGLKYGSPEMADQPGSGGGGTVSSTTPGLAGGGAIRIDASGDVEVNGDITAEGLRGNYTASGSGGGISISCNTIYGTGSISSQGGRSGNGGGGAGGGGRIRLAYNTVAQSSVTIPSLVINAGPGYNSDNGDAGLGTISVPDNYFLGTTVSDICGWLYVPSFSSWDIDSLTLNDSWLGFSADNFNFVVTNDVDVSGVSKLSFGKDSTVNVGGDMACNFIINGSGSFDIKGDLSLPVIANQREYYSFSYGQDIYVEGSMNIYNRLYLYGDPTNGVEESGILLDVAADLLIDNGAYIYTVSNPTNGGSPLIKAQNINLVNGGSIDASGFGFAGKGEGDGQGYGPGGGLSYLTCGGGGGYGGRGSYGLRTDGRNGAGGISNDFRYAPKWAGSAGGRGPSSSYIGQNGGGYIRIEVTDTFNANGDITANGRGAYVYAGAGAGGSIFIIANIFAGTATSTLQANGGAPSGNGGGFGGGGRIAVLYGDISSEDRATIFEGRESSLGSRFQATTSYSEFLGAKEAKKGVYTYTSFAEDSMYDAQDGTVFFVTVIPPQGSVIIIE